MLKSFGSEVSERPISLIWSGLIEVLHSSSSSGLLSGGLIAGFNLCVSLRDSLRAHSRAT